MRDYIEYEITIEPYSDEFAEILGAQLTEIGFEGLTYTDSGFLAYIAVDSHEEDKIATFLSQYNSNYQLIFQAKLVKDENWNSNWEQDFDPIKIDNSILVRAPFHSEENGFTYEIIIQPNMSFGTGHHDTTQAILKTMLNYDFKDKSVLDIGCGTGILSILASKLKSASITAIDIHDFAYQNTLDNLERNNAQANVLLGDISVIPDQKFNIILANIGKNITLQYMSSYAKLTDRDGLIFVSGFYDSDIDDIKESFELNAITFKEAIVRNNWAVCIGVKN